MRIVTYHKHITLCILIFHLIRILILNINLVHSNFLKTMILYDILSVNIPLFGTKRRDT